MLLHELAPEALRRVHGHVLVELIAEELLLVLVGLDDVKLADPLHRLEVLFHQILLDLDFAAEDDELVVESGTADFTVHELEDCLELVLKLVLEDEGIDDLEVDVLGEPRDCLFDQDRHEFIELTGQLLLSVVAR